MRLISWFFIILNFMEYIGSQNASRGRRQRRSKCGVFSAFARSLPPRSPVGSPGRCGAGTRRGGPPALRPTPPTEVTVQAPGGTAPLTPSSPHPSVTRRHARAAAGHPGCPGLSRPRELQVRGGVGSFLWPALGIRAFLSRLGRGPRIPGTPLPTEETRGAVRARPGSRSPRVAAPRGETWLGSPVAIGC